MRQEWFVAAVLGVSMLAVAQQPPKVINAQFHTEPVGAGLSATVGRFQHSSGPLWLGYEVAAVPRTRFAVCSGNGDSMDDGCCGVYRLEDSDNSFRTSDNAQPAQTNIDVLVRIDQGAVDKVRFIGTGCRVDAGGLPFTWITDVQPDDSVAWLSSLVTAGDKRHADQALAAIAMHETSGATAALAGFTSSSNPLWVREKAAFWLGAGRGHDGLLELEKLAKDSDPEFRKKLAFDFSVNHDPAAVDDLIRMAKSDADTRVREQAIFWVAQKAGKKAVATLKDALENDPEVSVKKKAVFALSQLPKDEAVPQLLHVAQTNSDPAVRKEAIFWLGQTHDPRALAWFEQILEK
ncbi:MAG TPA: HEAT repeat domain-containing protein [Acidobacteriaceae bacterium]|nr:HEAT repeat domain-containing protein [Acidobacteriaceae bacterium]